MNVNHFELKKTAMLFFDILNGYVPEPAPGKPRVLKPWIQNAVRLGKGLQPRREVRRLTNHGLLLRGAGADQIAHNPQAGRECERLIAQEENRRDSAASGRDAEGVRLRRRLIEPRRMARAMRGMAGISDLPNLCERA